MTTACIGADLDRVYEDESQFPLGEIFVDHDGSVYKFVEYSEEAAATDGVAGEVAYYVADSGYGNSKVTSDLSASDEVGAGVLQTALSDGEFGWIQIKGPATLTIALTAGADGDPLTATGATDGTLDVSAAATDVNVAIAADASAKEIICDFPW